MGMTFFFMHSHASATWAEDRPTFSATLPTSRAMDRFRSLNSVNGDFSSRPPDCFPFSYLPVSSPLANGDQAATVSPSASAIGIISRSGVRSIRLYSTCSETNGDHPRSSASVFARLTHHAGASEIPA